ncbi:MAG: sulfurtransferase [Spirochaetaceae bacterium]|nr:sulfurtransferase [Spirochaetaceae bacterium]MDT8299352.1 sulfurtransferase [Spirochaetaceae bacterium]
MMKRLMVFVALIAAMTALTFAESGEEVSPGPAIESDVDLPSRLIDAYWLEEHLGAENLVILDTARKPGEYSSSHVPGALYADRSGFYQEVDGIPGMFPGVEKTVSWLETLGVSNDSAVVVYDAGSGPWAARLAWTLAYLGHENWAVLDGGYGLWEADGLPLATAGTATVAAGYFLPDVRDSLLVSGDELLADLYDPGVVVVDARSSGEYNGSDVRADRGGHIPGALSIEWTLNNSSGTLPTLLGVEELAEFYATEGVDAEDRVVAHCQTGVRGAHTWLALTLAGYDNVALYDGSWIEWANDERFPVE